MKSKDNKSLQEFKEQLEAVVKYVNERASTENNKMLYGFAGLLVGVPSGEPDGRIKASLFSDWHNDTNFGIHDVEYRFRMLEYLLFTIQSERGVLNGDGGNVISFPAFEGNWIVPSNFKYQGLKIPEVNTENLSLVAFYDTNKEQYKTIKYGRLITHFFKDLTDFCPDIAPYVNNVSELLTDRYITYRKQFNGYTKLYVGCRLKDFQYAYQNWNWSACKSCMAEGEPDEIAKKEWLSDSDEGLSNTDNHAARFYDNLNGDDLTASIAMLLDQDNNVLARCILWTICNDVRVKYADRMYYNTKSDADLLIKKLYDGEYIKYNKVIGVGCSDVYSIVDKNGQKLDPNTINSWWVWCSLNDGDPIAYMDTFKYYDDREGDLTPCNRDHNCYKMETTEELYFPTTPCDECGDNIHEGEIFVIDGQNLCESCYDNCTTECHHCGERHLSSNMTEFNDEFYCRVCYEKHIIECDVCGSVFHESDGIITDDGQYHYYCCDDCAEKGGQSYCEICGDYCPNEEVSSYYDNIKQDYREVCEYCYEEKQRNSNYTRFSDIKPAEPIEVLSLPDLPVQLELLETI